MPFILPAAATAVAAAAPAVAAQAVAQAAFVATLKSVAINALTNLALSAVMSALQPQVGTAGRTYEWTLDPDAPIPFAFGRVGVAGAVVYPETFGPDKMYYGFVSVLSGAGPITGFQSFRGDDETVTFDGNGKATSSQWANEMWMRTRLGTQPDTALVTPTGLKNGVTLPGWNSASKLSGKACYMLILGENSKRSAYPNGEPKPLWVIQGLKCYDPRLDSTYPGGSGSCRLNTPSTWVYSQNPIIHALKWALGLWEGPTGQGAPQVDYQVGGIGAKPEGIDFPSFVSAANIADLNGWTSAAYPTTDDPKAQVLDGFLQAGGAVYAQKAGKIACIQRGSPRTSIVTITAADTAGPIEFDAAASRINRINTIRPRFWSEAHRWQLTALPEVTASSYITEDGGKRPRGIDFPFVTNATQCGQLAALQIANTREGIAGTIPLKPHLQRITPGDAFTITEPGFVLDGLKCLCLNTNYDPATGVHRVTFVSETDAKYAFAMGQSPVPPESPTLTPANITVTPPAPSDWAIVVRAETDDGIQLPIWDLVGGVSNTTATAVIVEWGAAPAVVDPGVPLANQIAWNEAYAGSVTATRIPIQGMQPGGTYYVAVRYARGQNFSVRTLYGPEVVPDFAAISPADRAALDRIAIIDSDGYLSKNEKPRVTQDWQVIATEYPGISAQALAIGVLGPRAVLEATYLALNNYITFDIDPPYFDFTTDSIVTPGVLSARFREYYVAKQAVADAIWNAVNGEIDDINSDNVLSKGEKSRVIKDWDVFFREYLPLYNAGTIAWVIAERDAFQSAFLALQTFLGSLSPAWNDVTQPSIMDGEEFRIRVADLEVARADLQIAISEAGGAVNPPTTLPVINLAAVSFTTGVPQFLVQMENPDDASLGFMFAYKATTVAQFTHQSVPGAAPGGANPEYRVGPLALDSTYELYVAYQNAAGIGPYEFAYSTLTTFPPGARIPRLRTPAFPTSSTETVITIAAHNALMESGELIALPSGTITGLTGLTVYGVFWKDGVGYQAEAQPATTRMTTGRWVFVGWQSTSDAGGTTYVPPTAPPGGSGGSGDQYDVQLQAA